MLLKNDAQIVRVLEEREGQKLVVSCTQKSMPVWINEEDLNGYTPCTEAELLQNILDFEDLSPEQQRYAHERFTLIAGVIPFLGDKQLRSEVIARIALARNISKQTIRHYLYRYLKYQNIAALAPPSKKQPDQLTRDEKNMRWAINKFYYTRHKNSLTSAYTQMLKHKYCDAYANNWGCQRWVNSHEEDRKAGNRQICFRRNGFRVREILAVLTSGYLS